MTDAGDGAPDPDPDPDETLDDTGRTPLPRRIRIALGVLAVAVVAVAVVVTVRQEDGRDRREGRPSPSLTLPTGNYRTTVGISPCGEPGGDTASCRVTIGVPHAVIVALRAAFPRGTVDASSSVSNAAGVLFTRRISVVATDVQIDLHLGVEAHRTASHYRVAKRRHETVTSYAADVLARDGRRFLFEVDVLDSRRGAGVARADLERLARDPRLLTRG